MKSVCEYENEEGRFFFLWKERDICVAKVEKGINGRTKRPNLGIAPPFVGQQFVVSKE